jgi:hypothetical protein
VAAFSISCSKSPAKPQKRRVTLLVRIMRGWQTSRCRSTAPVSAMAVPACLPRPRASESGQLRCLSLQLFQIVKDAVKTAPRWCYAGVKGYAES